MAAASVSNWLQQLWNIAFGGQALTPGQIWLNFLAPFTITPNPNNVIGGQGGSFDVGLNVSGLTAFDKVTTSATYTIPASGLTGFDSTSNLVALSTPSTSADGAVFGAFDAASNVEGAGKGATLQDVAKGYLIQNPIDQTLNAQISWGPGGGGGPNPPLQDGKFALWMRVTCANVNSGQPYWKAMSA
jgi:hypothetical protein